MLGAMATSAVGLSGERNMFSATTPMAHSSPLQARCVVMSASMGRRTGIPSAHAASAACCAPVSDVTPAGSSQSTSKPMTFFTNRSPDAVSQSNLLTVSSGDRS